MLQTWSIGPSTFTANPACGARLMRWDVAFGHAQTREIFYWPENADWQHPEKIRGGNPILFPFVARTFAGAQENYWQPQEGPILPMPRHGFARAGQFKVEELTAEGFLARLCPTPEDQAAYPFDYTFRVRYTFEELALKVTLSLENKGLKPLPWCAGHHFYFQIPWHSGLSRKAYELRLSSKKAYYHTPAGGLEAAPKPLSVEKLDNPILIDRLHTQLRDSVVTFGPSSLEESITLRIGDTPIPSPTTTITTWTEAADSPFYCIEPWMGLPNAPSHGKGLHYVNAYETAEFTITIQL